MKINWSHIDRKDMDHMIFINQKYPTYNIPYTSYMIDIIWPISYGRYFRWSISKFRKRNLWKYVAVWFFLIRYSKILTLDNSEFYFCKIGWLFDYSSRFEEKICEVSTPNIVWLFLIGEKSRIYTKNRLGRFFLNSPDFSTI